MELLIVIGLYLVSVALAFWMLVDVWRDSLDVDVSDLLLCGALALFPIFGLVLAIFVFACAQVGKLLNRIAKKTGNKTIWKRK